MDKAQFEHELRFMVAMMVTKRLLTAGIIDATDYAKIESRILKKYHPFFGEMRLETLPL